MKTTINGIPFDTETGRIEDERGFGFSLEQPSILGWLGLSWRLNPAQYATAETAALVAAIIEAQLGDPVAVEEVTRRAYFVFPPTAPMRFLVIGNARLNAGLVALNIARYGPGQAAELAGLEARRED